MDVEQALSSPEEPLVSRKDFGFLFIPRRLRHSTTRPFEFGPWSNIVFGIGCSFTVANMYYCQPLLIQMATDFRTTYADTSLVPTMYQLGYCVGLSFISPLGDLLRRRQLILALVFITTCLSVGLALSKTLLIFKIFAFFLGVFNVTPQILVPFAADLASPRHRGAAVSVLQSGIMVGILLARVMAGVIAYYFYWRTVYYASIGVQIIALIGTYLFIPDQPCKNPDLTYLKTLYTMVTYLINEPRLVQVVLINVASVACWSSFWEILTFLLGGPPYDFSTLYIGLFGLIGVVGVLVGPIFGPAIDRFGPWLALLASTCCLLVFQSIGTAAEGINIAVVVVVCVGLNTFRQVQTVTLQTIIFGISENARSRLNAVLTLSLSAGQAMGSSAGSSVFLAYGWRAASALSMAWYAWQLLILFLRGPNCKRYTWFGYEGGFASRATHDHQNDDTATSTTQTQTQTQTLEVKSSLPSVPSMPSIHYLDPNRDRVERETSETTCN